MSCSAMPSRRTGRDEAFEAANTAVGGEIGVEDDEARFAFGQAEHGVAVRSGDVLVRHLRLRGRHTGPDSGSPASTGALLRLLLDGLQPERLEFECGHSVADPLEQLRVRLGEGLVVRCTGVPKRYVPPPSRRATGCSMNETPLPLIVCATRALGCSSPASRNSPNAARRAAWS